MARILFSYVPVMFFAFCLTGLCSAPFGDQGEQDVIKLETTLVQVPVTVSDSGGRYIIDLTASDFEIYEDAIKQDVAFFRSIDEPFSVALLLDCSGSTRDQLDRIKSAARLFLTTLRSSDRAMILAFSDSVEVLCELTSDRAKLDQGIERITAGEYTQVYEAVYTAVWEKLRDIEGRKAVIVFSDGIDTASSEISQEDTLDAVVESEDVIIYPIRFGTRSDVEKRIAESAIAKKDENWRVKLDRTYRAADEYLYRLAEMSGGVVERADVISDLPGALLRISEELRRQYLLGFYPRKRDWVKHRDLRVTVKREGARVRVRPGYSL